MENYNNHKLNYPICMEPKTFLYGMCRKIIIIEFLLIIILVGCEGVRPTNLGVKDGMLAPCPDKPNCVSSQSTNQTNTIAPLTYSSTAKDAIADLKNIIGSMKNVSIIEESLTYLRYEFTSRFFRFIDDVEFFLDDTQKIIHLRSSSRIGYSDLGVNRRRMERIREEWKNR
jgi:uncharacterized protein (DUF1499 family)